MRIAELKQIFKMQSQTTVVYRKTLEKNRTVKPRVIHNNRNAMKPECMETIVKSVIKRNSHKC